ncbi:uncharacterized protein A4U43_C01F940 [Asparagus officinalis]|uniref:Protein kinase domain-containing protein n=1 Tax=Asparagus officinalis TaxID=4686 RepID=A0A5P1FME9_ASPOF|nr:uncharacterized protein A4U43_C01F940 [Asparagus officinalis]
MGATLSVAVPATVVIWITVLMLLVFAWKPRRTLVMEVSSGAVTAVKYRLPDEDLDALISISSQEDLDNMMEEFDRLNETVADGSARIRMFLESADSSEVMDSGHGESYIDAVNGIDLRRKEGMSPSVLSTSFGSIDQDPSRLRFSPDETLVSRRLNGNFVNILGSETYGCPLLLNAASMVSVGDNFRPVQDKMEPLAVVESNLKSDKRKVEGFVEDNLCRYDQNQNDNNGTGGNGNNNNSKSLHHQPLSEMPPLHPIHIQQMPSMIFRTVRLNDCQMSQEPLLHAHANTLVNEQRNGNGLGSNAVHETRTVLQSYHSEDPMRLQASLKPENLVETKVETATVAGNLSSPRRENGRVIHPNVEALDHAKVSHQVGVMGVADPTRRHSPPKIVNGVAADSVPKVETLPTESQFGTNRFTQDTLHPHEKESVVHPNIEVLDSAKVLIPHNTVSGTLTKNMVEPKVDNMAASSDGALTENMVETKGQFGASGFTHDISHPLEKERLVHPKVEALDPTKVLVPNNAISGALTVNMVEPKADSMAASSQFVNYGYSQFPKQSQLHDDDRLLVNPNVPTAVGLPVDTQTSYAGAANLPLSHFPDPFQPLMQNMAPHNHLVKQDPVTNQNFSIVKNGKFHAAALPNGGSPPETHDNVKPINGMMESLHVSTSGPSEASNGNFSIVKNGNLPAAAPSNGVSPPETLENVRPISGMIVSTSKPSEITEHPRTEATVDRGVPVLKRENSLVTENTHATKSQVEGNPVFLGNSYMMPAVFPNGNSFRPVTHLPPPSMDLKPGHHSLAAYNNQGFRLQAGGDAVYLGNAFIDAGLVPQRNSVRLTSQMPPSSMVFTHLQSLQSSDTSQASTVMANHGPLISYNQEMVVRSDIQNERLFLVPAYSYGITPAYDNNDSVNMVPVGGQKYEASLFHLKDPLNNIAVPLNGTVISQISNSGDSSGHVEQFQGPVPSNSLFCNQDPRNILGDMHLLLPSISKMPSQESISPKDLCTENPLVTSKGSELAMVAEDGFDHLQSSKNKDLITESVRHKQGEDHNKQEVQGLPEQAFAAVFEPSVPPTSVTSPHKIPESVHPSNRETGITNKQADKVNFGFPLTDEIGHLQIIKNSDLEELRELGSGTFGTVYHGKWRGSDVAIKRINDRCFAGKPAEEERMRADFWNEAIKLADLHHPNVVAFYGVVLDGPGGSFATVTEFMVNGSLRRALQKNHKLLDNGKRLLIAMDVAFGMEYLHGKNIIHFDLKSDNLLVNLRDAQRPICKVADLGLSKVKCQTLISGGVRGTLPWMAPELLNGGSNLVSDKVDVFSFAIVMWELLTGEEPYADLHYGAIIGGIVSNTLRPPIPEACDPEWRSLMEQCWAAEPSERPNFSDIANRLRSMAASLPQKL